MKTIEEIMRSTEFLGMHKNAQEDLGVTLPSLFSQGFIEDSDYVSLKFAMHDIDMFYHLKDEVGTKYTIQNAKGFTISNPLLKEMSQLQRNAMTILNNLGGSTRSRRSLNKKEMSQAENNGMDELFQSDKLWGDGDD